MTAKEKLRTLLMDRCTSFDMQRYLSTALFRDPVDVANELEVVAKLARAWAKEVSMQES